MKNLITQNKKIGLISAIVVAALGFAMNTQAATITAADVALHNTATDCWIILNGNVYNLTTFIPLHAGGAAVIISQCGKDGTAVFNSGPHPAGTINVLNPFLLGPLGTTATTPVLTTVTVTPLNPTMVASDTLQLAVSTKDQDGSAIASTLSFSSSNTAVATVDSTGLVTSVSAGIAQITVTAVNGTTTLTTNTVVTVTPMITPVLTTVTVSPATSSIMVGGTQLLTVSTKDQNGNAIGATSTFSSSNTAVATVNSTGMVTGVGSGTTTITVTSMNGTTTVTGTSVITVTPVVQTTPVLTTVMVTPATASVATGGDTLQLTASPKDQFGNAISATVTFSSSNPAMATVNNSGLVTGVASGTVTITATAMNGSITVTGTSVITVVPVLVPEATTVTVTPVTSTIMVGGTQQLTITVSDLDGDATTTSSTFSSSNPLVATVSSTGMVTGVGAGTVTITATVVSEGSTFTGTAVVTVTAPPVVNNEENEDGNEMDNGDHNNGNQQGDHEDGTSTPTMNHQNDENHVSVTSTSTSNHGNDNHGHSNSNNGRGHGSHND